MNGWMNEMNVILSEVFYSTIDLLLYALLKGSSDATFTLQVFFKHKCVLEVCVHIDPIMIKIPPVFFF